jgi:hypothetical protein
LRFEKKVGKGKIPGSLHLEKDQNTGRRQGPSFASMPEEGKGSSLGRHKWVEHQEESKKKKGRKMLSQELIFLEELFYARFCVSTFVLSLT